MNFARKLSEMQAEANAALDRRLPPADTRPVRLHEAMHYSVSAGGKRLRPVLVMAARELYPGEPSLIAAAVAVECIHAYSLIHDDLPAMDDADLRRGKPACHKAFDEATAILAGDALLPFAFEVLATDYADHPELAARLVATLARAAGSEKLVGGQMEDLLAEGSEPEPSALAFVHANKTAALLTACVEMGLLLGARGKDEETLEKGRRLGLSLGLAFQAVDDLLDVTRTTEELGKAVAVDAARGKMTWVALRGVEEAERLAAKHTEDALEVVRELGGDNAFLLELVKYLLEREK